MIEVVELCKRFGDQIAVDELSFTVSPGEVLGFLGPNGAGKSTTMKMIAGYLTPSGGSIRVCGHTIGQSTRDAQRLIGYLPEGVPLYEDMQVIQFLGFIAEIRSLEGAQIRQRIEAVVGQLELASVLNQRIETLSKGFKRRVGLAQALLHDPKVLILDEPTDGLDPNQKHQVRNLIHGLSADKIVIISTHILEEVDAVCNRAIIIADGRLLADGSPAELESRSPLHRSVQLHFTVSVDCQAALAELPGVKAVEIADDGRHAIVYPETEASLLPAVAELVRLKGWAIDDLHVERGRLDEVFRQLTRQQEQAA